ncbi:MAG TPA: ABC transporter permease [Streptosporangiaceae bacterium]|nr:ABC transporter permease [Streptosporangiaceae bacterium]
MTGGGPDTPGITGAQPDPSQAPAQPGSATGGSTASAATATSGPAEPATAVVSAEATLRTDSRAQEERAAAQDRAELRRASLGRRLLRRTITANESWTILALIVIMAFFTIKAPGTFLTTNDLSLIAQNASPLLVMAIGQTFVILTAGIDLSVGSVLVLSSVIADEYYQHHGAGSGGWLTVIIGMVIAIAVTAAWGGMQGFLVAKAKIPPLISTLGGFGAALGISYLITGGVDLGSPPGPVKNTIGAGSVAGVSWLIVISFVATLVFGLILSYTRFGRYTYAIGSNPEAGRRAGIAVDRHLIKVYALAGALSGLAGIMSLGFNDGTTLTGHTTDNLTVITGVVLGGASLFGGRGSMLGTFIGIFIPQVLNSGLVILGVNVDWQQVAIGVVLVGAVYLDQFRLRLRDRAG